MSSLIEVTESFRIESDNSLHTALVFFIKPTLNNQRILEDVNEDIPDSNRNRD